MTRSELVILLRTMHFTPIEKKILGLLCDGGRYDMETVRQAAYPTDGEAGNNNLATHITNIRIKLREIQHTILSEYIKGVMYYQYVLFSTITSDNGPMKRGNVSVE